MDEESNSPSVLPPPVVTPSEDSFIPEVAGLEDEEPLHDEIHEDPAPRNEIPSVPVPSVAPASKKRTKPKKRESSALLLDMESTAEIESSKSLVKKHSKFR